MKIGKTRLTFWKVVLWAILAPGIYALIYRFSHGLGDSTTLSDAFPWGLWVGFKLFAIALAGGGFTAGASADDPHGVSGVLHFYCFFNY